MIETIFYFPQNKAQYDSNVGNISERTISFVPTGDGETGDIYKNGIKYGCGISESSINEVINNLPFASTTQAGIIKLGKGLKSVGNDGTVDVDFTGLNGTDGIDGLDGLIESILKTIINKNGTGVVVTPRSLSGSTVAIADIQVGNDTKTIYAPVGSNGGGDNPGGGTTYVENPYDDSAIRDAIDGLLATSRSESQRLDNLINTLDNEIQDKVEDMFNDAEWIQNNWPEGLTTGDSNFGEDDVESYLQRLGFWTTDENGNTVTQWSKIQQEVDSISLAVNALSSDGEITEALQASIDQAVENGVAKLNLSTTYAKADDTKKVIEWLTSGFRSETSGEMTYNEILSAANNGNHSGISDLYSRVTEIEGSYVAEAGFNAKVDNAIAGIQASTDGTYSSTSLFNQIDTNKNDISGIRSYINENGASAALLAQLGTKYAGIDVAVKKDGDGYISDAMIKADKIYLDGQTNFLTAVGDYLSADEAFIAKLNADQALIGYYQSKNDGIYCEIDPGSFYSTLKFTDGSTTYARLSIDGYEGGTSNGGMLLLYNPNDNINTYIDGGSIWMMSNDNLPCLTISGDYSDPMVIVNDQNGSSASLHKTGVSTSSDMRLKDVIADKSLTAEQIASAPIFTYKPKANPNANPLIGTSAQYWQEITPEVVSELNGYLALDYTKVATASVINLAKEVVTLKSENTTLKQRVEALEARLQLIENKLNA